MQNSVTSPTLRAIAGIVAAITFLANLITVALFIRDLLMSSIEFTTVLSQIAVIGLMFAFAFLLLYYSKDAQASPDTIILIFSWLYIVFSATIFAIISKRFIIEASYSLVEYFGSNVLVFLIAGLGYSVASFMKARTGYFSIPYMLVALEQIILWILLIFSRSLLSFSIFIMGNLFLFVLVSGYVLFFIWDDVEK